LGLVQKREGREEKEEGRKKKGNLAIFSLAVKCIGPRNSFRNVEKRGGTQKDKKGGGREKKKKKKEGIAFG